MFHRSFVIKFLVILRETFYRTQIYYASADIHVTLCTTFRANSDNSHCIFPSREYQYQRRSARRGDNFDVSRKRIKLCRRIYMYIRLPGKRRRFFFPSARPRSQKDPSQSPPSYRCLFLSLPSARDPNENLNDPRNDFSGGCEASGKRESKSENSFWQWIHSCFRTRTTQPSLPGLVERATRKGWIS